MSRTPPIAPHKTVCEFFAGIGLVQEALRSSGWRCIYANDIDPKKRSMYEGHYGASSHYHEGDVWDVDAVLERIPEQPFLATASFPCTDMSLAGKRRGLGGAQSGSLFGFLQVVEQLGDWRPKVVLLENVTGFLNSHGGDDFAVAVQELAGLGYWLDSFVLDAKQCVPQSRPRLFLVGYQPEVLRPPLICRDLDAQPMSDPWLQAVQRSDLLHTPKLRTVIDALQPATGWATIDTGNPHRCAHPLAQDIDLDQEQKWWEQAEVDRHRRMMFERHLRQIELIAGSTEQPTVLTAFRRVRDGKQRLEVRFDGVAGCLRTPRGGSAKQIVVAIDRGRLRMRWMSPREYARLQGAPDYTLPENTNQALFGFGDAVCVPVIRWIDEQMLTPVYEAAIGAVTSKARPAKPQRDGRPVLSR